MNVLVIIFVQVLFQYTAVKPECQTSNLGLDIIFLLEGSSAVSDDDFNTAKNWIKNFSSNFDLNAGTHRIGVIQFSHYFDTLPPDSQTHIKTEIELGQFRNQSQFNMAVDDVSKLGLLTFTAKALNKSLQDFQSSERFNDNTTFKALVVMTDTIATDFDSLASTASYVRSNGITLYAVGGAPQAEMNAITNGVEDKSFELDDFSQLFEITDQLRGKLTSTIETITPCLDDEPFACTWTVGQQEICVVTFMSRPKSRFINILKDGSPVMNEGDNIFLDALDDSQVYIFMRNNATLSDAGNYTLLVEYTPPVGSSSNHAIEFKINVTSNFQVEPTSVEVTEQIPVFEATTSKENESNDSSSLNIPLVAATSSVAALTFIGLIAAVAIWFNKHYFSNRRKVDTLT
ncbi:unnamed protein product [Clavelina lepadiformis]|uniref:VWFA domain-containing protein n=1 Tax=Clavelina lepadiformis TaxID=159417 RepID=A0ABP0FGE1_CLALP